MIFGNRVPYEYFITTGRGESDVGSPGLKYETGSYDQALTEAGIENCNVVEYTSVIPTIAREITKEQGLKRLRWGEVLECIKAETDGPQGSFLSSAVMTIYVYDSRKQWLGGFAVEYSNRVEKEKETVDEAAEIKNIEVSLSRSIQELIARRGLGTVQGALRLYQDNVTDTGYVIHPGKDFIHSMLHVRKKHGSVLSALCFVSYQVPVLQGSESTKGGTTRGRNTRKRRVSKSWWKI